MRFPQRNVFVRQRWAKGKGRVVENSPAGVGTPSGFEGQIGVPERWVNDASENAGWSPPMPFFGHGLECVFVGVCVCECVTRRMLLLLCANFSVPGDDSSFMAETLVEFLCMWGEPGFAKVAKFITIRNVQFYPLQGEV